MISSRARLLRLLVTALLLLVAPSVWGDPSVAMGPASGTFGEGLGPASVSDAGGMAYSIPFELPVARGDVQPGLALTYASGSGDREAGHGWGLGTPTIERYALSGWPTGDNSSDRFSYGGQPLVFVCTVGGMPACPQSEVALPAWAAGW